MNKQDYIRRIQREYDKIYVSCSGGKDSIASLIFAQKHFDKDKIRVIWVDVGYDFPELYPYMLYAISKADVHLDVLKVPTPFEQLADVLGNLSHRTRWCGPEGKFFCISHYFSLQPQNEKHISFEGTRWAESRARLNRAYFSDESESFVNNATFRPVLDFSDYQVCNYCLRNGFSLNPSYRFFDRTGCFICPEHTLETWAILRTIYPNLFQKFLQFLKHAKHNTNWVKYYAFKDLVRYTKQSITKDNFKPPFTAGYVFMDAITKVLDFNTDTIRDNPDYTFERAVEDVGLSIDYSIIQTPQPERHKEMLAGLSQQKDAESNKKGKGTS